MSIQIYHNPRCRKSREALAVLEDLGKRHKVIEYLKEPLTSKELKNIISLLGISAEGLVRKNEAIWKENFKGKKMTESAIIKAMVNHPKLIQRPIVVKGKKAIIARPAELLDNFI